MAGLFSKATAKAVREDKPSRAKKATTWVVGDPEKDQVAKAIHELVELSAQEKAIKAKKSMASKIVLKHANTNYIHDFCDLGVPPDTPMIVQNHDGEKVTYVVQDRTGQYAVKEEQREILEDVLGEDAVDDLLYEETKIGFDRSILALPGVTEAVEKALERTITKLVKDEVLTEEQADALVVADHKVSFKPGTLDRAALIAGRDTARLSALLDAMGSSVTRYIRS